MPLESFEFSLLEGLRNEVMQIRSDIYYLKQHAIGQAEQLFRQSKILRRMVVVLILTNTAVVFMCAAFLISHFLKK